MFMCTEKNKKISGNRVQLLCVLKTTQIYNSFNWYGSISRVRDFRVIFLTFETIILIGVRPK